VTKPLDPNRSVWTELRRLVPSIYLPMGMVTLGMGIVLPVIPLYLEDAGLSLSMVGAVLAAAGIGAAVGAIPASSYAERRDNDELLMISIVVVAVTTALVGITEAAMALLVLRAMSGFGFGAIGQSRQLFIARSVPIHFRGRASSVLGGTHRFALVMGPLIGGAVAETWNYESVFVLAGVVTAIGLVWGVLPGGRENRAGKEIPPPARLGVTFRKHRRLLLRGGTGPLLVMAGREGRYVVVPLVGDRLGLSAGEIGSLVALGTAVDFVLFPFAGWVMDRFGRLNAVVPAFSIMAMGMIMLGLAHTTTQVAMASVLIGGGNALTAGSVITLGTDLAPDDAPGPFLAGYNVLANSGLFIGPLVVGWVADAAGLDVSAFVLAAMLLGGVAWIALVVGETRHGPNKVSGLAE